MIPRYITSTFYDRAYIEDRGGDIYVVAGNRHPPGGVIAYRKYSPAKSSTLWCRRETCFERIVKTYDPVEVHASTKYKIYDPWSGSYVPYLPLSRVSVIHDPVVRLEEILSSPKDSVEEDIVWFVETLLGYSYIGSGYIGVTGSVLPGIHNPVASDIDLVVYGWRCGLNTIEALKEIARRYPIKFAGEKMRKWVLRLSRRYHVDPELIPRLYRVWRRGVLPSGREYSIAYTSRRPLRFGDGLWVSRGRVRVKALVEPGVEVFNYPSIARVTRYRVIEGGIRYRLRWIVSYETTFQPPLIEGGPVYIEGLLQEDPWTMYSRIILGVREYLGLLLPLEDKAL